MIAVIYHSVLTELAIRYVAWKGTRELQYMLGKR